MKRNKTYFIRTKTLENKILTFKNVACYDLNDGFIRFTDVKTNKTVLFPIANCEIEEVMD